MPDEMEYAPFSPDFKANPFPFYTQIREEQPIYRTTLSDGRPIWLVTRYEDVVAVLRDERFVKDVAHALTPEQLAKLPPVPPVLDLLAHDLLNQDPPNHTRLRALVSKAFTPFADPDAVDLTRDTHQHVAFGQGIHYCLGAPLARLEGQIAIGSLIQRFQNLRLTVPAESLTWRPGMLVRGLDRLPVAF